VTEDQALFELLGELRARDYHFITVTPETHAIVLARPRPEILTLREIFGWNRPFDTTEIEPTLLGLMRDGAAVEQCAGKLRSRVRVASLGGHLFLHSSYPTTSTDSVFFGPDTYRFCAFVTSELSAMEPPRCIVDMGAGNGAGGIIAANATRAERVVLVDSNPAAARLAGINARFGGVAAEIKIGDRIPTGCDLVIANPPYMIDTARRAYRDGGALYGGEVAVNWAEQALSSLTAGGALLLYTGAPIVEGSAPLLEELEKLANGAGAILRHSEIDPDIFGNELRGPEYSAVDRIAALRIKLITRS
jgi:methylase of polypeptide subunit release factors